MARHLTRTLTPLAVRSVHHSLSSSSSFKFFSTKPQLLEVELSSDGGEVDLLGLKRLEDAIHTIIVRRLAPDWLPFRPGSSYWVPPKRHTGNILQLVGNLTNPLSHEESLSLSSARGWPSSSFFTQGISAHPIPVEVDVQVYVEDSPKKLSGDEE